MEKINYLFEQLVSISIKSLPSKVNWETLIFKIKILITYSENTTEYSVNGQLKGTLGRYTDENGVRISSSNIAWQLREAMYNLSPEKGVWYSMEMTMLPSGNYNLQFDYEIKPEFSIPLSDLDFIKDFQKFPRKKEFIPEWLDEILKRNQIV